MKTRIKFCGLVDRGDVDIAVSLGVDAVGAVLYPRSPRAVDEATARAIRRGLPSFVRFVGLFVNHDEAEVARLSSQLGFDVLQFHGDESRDYCERVAGNRPYWRAVRMRGRGDLIESKAHFASAEALLLDTYSVAYGGSGHAFDWSWIEPAGEFRYVMSGGLTPDNVGEAIEQTHPCYVDVSSGIQTADPRRKDPVRMARFIEQVLDADLRCARAALAGRS